MIKDFREYDVYYGDDETEEERIARLLREKAKWKLIKNLKDCAYIGKQLCQQSRIFISNKELQDLLNNEGN
jgi:hypothetical protein